MGKSTLLREALAPYVSLTAGFVVQRLCENSGETAFRAICLEDSFPQLEGKYSPNLDGIFVLPGRKLDVTTLENIILRVEEQAQDSRRKMILLDEIGGVELASPVFMGALERLLSSRKPCFGVFKSRENFSRTSSNLSLPPDYADLHSRLEAKILSHGKIITLTAENRAQTLNRLKEVAAGIKGDYTD